MYVKHTCISLCVNHTSYEITKIVLIEKTFAIQFLLLTVEKNIQTRVAYMLYNLYVHLIVIVQTKNI